MLLEGLPQEAERCPGKWLCCRRDPGKSCPHGNTSSFQQVLRASLRRLTCERLCSGQPGFALLRPAWLFSWPQTRLVVHTPARIDANRDTADEKPLLSPRAGSVLHRLRTARPLTAALAGPRQRPRGLCSRMKMRHPRKGRVPFMARVNQKAVEE